LPAVCAAAAAAAAAASVGAIKQLSTFGLELRAAVTRHCIHAVTAIQRELKLYHVELIKSAWY